MRATKTAATMLAALCIAASANLLAQNDAPTTPVVPPTSAAPDLSTAPQFRPDGDGISVPLLKALGFIVLIAVGAAVLVPVLRRRQGILAGVTGPKIRLIGAKRVSQKTQVLTIEIEGIKTVVIADNGQSLLSIAEWETPPRKEI